MFGLHENALQSYYEAQAPARMPCRTNHVDKANQDWERQAAKHRRLAKSSRRMQILRSRYLLAKNMQAHTIAKFRSVFLRFEVYV